MSERNRQVDRRTVLQGVGAGLFPLAVKNASADPVSEGIDEAVTSAPSVFGEVGRRVNEVRYPLVGVPAIKEPGETLRVELDTEVDSVSARLKPSFGAAQPETELSLKALEEEPSRIWGDGKYTVARFKLPRLDNRFTEGLYDLHVTFDGEADGQPRAVSVHRNFPNDPEIAIMGDPHAGDIRSLEDGFTKAQSEGNPDPFLFRYEEIVGNGTEEDRWGSWQRANAELNAQDPDIVLVIGDLTFGSAAYFQEYEDAYRILNQMDVPTFVTLGNHDGYVTPGAGIDGKELWRRYFAPWQYSVDIREDFHFVSIDSYDWPAIDRIAPSAVPSTWGGQVSEEQLEWLQSDLRSWRAENPNGTILTLSHHSPAWRQSQGELEDEFDGVPAAEQISRGAEQAGGGWAGKNRVAVRNLLREVDVSLHVAGHAHRDRVARDDGNGNVVETRGQGLRYIEEDHGETGPTRDADLEEILVDGDAPLYLEATTAASGTGQYWGWRTLSLPAGGGSLDPTGFGYPVTEAFLEDRAIEPDSWDAADAEFGLYSTPSYLLDAETQEATRNRVSIHIESDLARDFDGAVTLPLGAFPAVRVEGGQKVWQQVDGDWQDVRVAFTVPAEQSLTVTVERPPATQ